MCVHNNKEPKNKKMEKYVKNTKVEYQRDKEMLFE